MSLVFSKKNVKIARKNASSEYLLKNGFISENDAEMDKRAAAAVEAAIKKLEVRKKPIARFDVLNNKAYLEYPGEE
ncbi:hypothetical protein SAMN02910298_02797 [Pseudobutyrivibrio sp. YE44]|uniref:hypothetical protein n=1 Tax=Pseudobutyrivibrio sp. YE44 TaxID=1520802 RepID=UPI00088355DD|nr:hypothetical protein [Pseudobutyrivibrio sp. YE44]SDB54534.1 hypothetical protein SAMN02910298_02797 [Pseudobutyrivibrio sp. YE44]